MAVRSSGYVEVKVTYDRERDAYRGDLSWPEVGRDGVMSRALRHHKIARIPALAVHARMADKRAGNAGGLDAAAGAMIVAEGLSQFADWRDDGAGGQRLSLVRGPAARP